MDIGECLYVSGLERDFLRVQSKKRLPLPSHRLFYTPLHPSYPALALSKHMRCAHSTLLTALLAIGLISTTSASFLKNLGNRLKTMVGGTASKQTASQVAMEMNQFLFSPQESSTCKAQWLQKAATECTLLLTDKKRITPPQNPWTLADCVQIKTYSSQLAMLYTSQKTQSFGVQQCGNLLLPGYTGYQPFNGRAMNGFQTASPYANTPQNPYGAAQNGMYSPQPGMYPSQPGMYPPQQTYMPGGPLL